MSSVPDIIAKLIEEIIGFANVLWQLEFGFELLHSLLPCLAIFAILFNSSKMGLISSGNLGANEHAALNCISDCIKEQEELLTESNLLKVERVL
jgi:hypothetical protein